LPAPPADEHGYSGGITIVKDYVLARRLRHREVFVPLRHDPGHAQVDFGEALAEIAGVERQIHFFAMDLVPRSILYDNTTLAVARIRVAVKRGDALPSSGDWCFCSNRQPNLCVDRAYTTAQ
jgi:hypothetical protein